MADQNTDDRADRQFVHGPLRVFLDKYVFPLCVFFATLAFAEKSDLDPRHKIGVVVLGILAALSASVALSQEKGSASARVRRTFLASVVATLAFLAAAALYLQRGLPQPKTAEGVGPGPVTTKTAQPQSGSPSTKGPARQEGVGPSKSVPVEPDDFLEKYVNTGLRRTGDRPRWAFVISDRNHDDFPELNAAAIRSIAAADYRNVSLFRPALLRDGKLQDVYSADPVILRKISPLCDGLIVAIVDQSPVPDTLVSQVLTVEMNVRVRVVAVSSATVKNEFSILERGAGFGLAEAEKNARERAAQDLQSQLKESL